MVAAPGAAVGSVEAVGLGDLAGDRSVEEARAVAGKIRAVGRLV